MHLPWPQELLRFVLPLPNHGLVWGWGSWIFPQITKLIVFLQGDAFFWKKVLGAQKTTFGYGWILGYNMIQYGIIWYNGQQNWSYSTKPSILGVWWFWPSQRISVTNKGFSPSSFTYNKPSWWDMLGHVHTLCACPAPPQPRLQHLVRSTCSSASGFGVQDTHLAAVACDDPAHLHLLICDFGFCYTCILDAWGLSKSRSMIIMINDF